MSSATERKGNAVRMGATWLLILPVAVALGAGVGRLEAQNPAASVAVDASANRRAINPNIYGLAMAGTSDVAALNAPLNRIGGDLTSTYNWQLDTLNLSADWYYECFLQNTPLTPGKFADDYIRNTHSAGVGAEPMVTIPMLGYIAKLGAGNSEVWSFSIARYGAQTGVDPWNADAGNGVSAATGKNIVNNPADAYTPNSVATQQAWLQHLLATWGTSAAANGVKYYVLDNEPSIWSGTHRDAHPNPETYQELYNATVAYAGAIRAADPNARIVGPEEWSWWAMYLSGLDQANGTGASTSDYNTHNHTYYYPWLLTQLANYQKTTGTKLIDVLSVHCYNAIPDGADDSASGQATRNRETRILWDPAFVDPSWESSSGLNGGVTEWIPTMRNWVNQYYPGLQIGCTEYNWGDEANLNGATTQADVLGIYGREGFDLATRWTVPANPSPTYLASQIYRNYDGKLSTFGDTSVSATVANPDNLSSFAALRSKDGALTVMVINKQHGTTPVTIGLANFAAGGAAQAYQIWSATQTSIAQLASVTVAGNAIATTVPSQSITLFVIPAGGSIAAPPAPTSLAATAGNAAVTLTWNAAGGATSYTVKRGWASGGPYTAAGTVTSPAPTAFTDTGLTDGTTYYYVVSAANTAGTSANSAEVAATPTAPPAFSSSATASPNPVSQNAGTTITATVTCTANAMTGGSVQVLALDPGGNTAATQTFTAQSFTARQSHTYSLALTPALAGAYTVEVGVYSATGQPWSLNTAAGTITVNSPLSFTSTAAANPATVAVGATSAIAATVTASGSSGLTNSIVELQVFDKSGNATATQYWSGQNFAAGQTLKYSYNWTPASTVAAGTYTVMIGVFNASWTTDYYWNSAAATITVTGGSSPPAFASTATAKPPSVAVGATAAIAASVTDTGGGLANGNVLINVYLAGTTTVAGSQTFSGQNFTAGQTLKYTSNWTPASTVAAGTYTVEIGVFDSAWSTDYYWNGNAATITVTAAQPVPPVPAGLTAASGNGSVALAWTASTGAASYNVYRGTAAGGESATPIITGVAGAAYTNTGLANGTRYYYKVAAVSAGGTSGMSAEASATPQPPAPASIVATAGGGQSAPVNTAFQTALQATVKDAGGSPVAGAAVTFTAPGSGASGKFGAAATAMATTNSQGVATAPGFTASGTAGAYSVTAGVSGVSATASFPLTNTAAPTSTQVTGASAVYSAASQTVNLAAAVASGAGTVTGGSVAFTVKGLGSATAPVSNGHAAAALQIPAAAGAGAYSISASYSGDSAVAPSTGSGTLTIAKASPVVTWNNPAAIASGTALGAAQLDATASVAGTFVYTPPAGTLLAVGTNQQLQVVFTPGNAANYNSVTRTVAIDVTKAGGTAKLAVTYSLTREAATQGVTVHLTVTNSGTGDAAGVEITKVQIGTAAATGLPLALGTIAQGQSATAEVEFASTVGAAGARDAVSVSCTYTGGQLAAQHRMILP